MNKKRKNENNSNTNKLPRVMTPKSIPEKLHSFSTSDPFVTVVKKKQSVSLGVEISCFNEYPKT